MKYEEVYLKAYDSVAAARVSLGGCFACYNAERRHQSLDRRTPDSVYCEFAGRLAACPEEALNYTAQSTGSILPDGARAALMMRA